MAPRLQKSRELLVPYPIVLLGHNPWPHIVAREHPGPYEPSTIPHGFKFFQVPTDSEHSDEYYRSIHALTGSGRGNFKGVLMPEVIELHLAASRTIDLRPKLKDGVEAKIARLGRRVTALVPRDEETTKITLGINTDNRDKNPQCFWKISAIAEIPEVRAEKVMLQTGIFRTDIDRSSRSRINLIDLSI